MRTLRTGHDWLDGLIPDGLPYPSSTLISGPGGTGKPLVEFAFVASWLKAGGSVISIPVQYPRMELLKAAMKKLYGLDLEDYPGKVAYIQFDPHMHDFEAEAENFFRANLLVPETWDRVVLAADRVLEKHDPGTLVFASALNLLLFSPTYQDGTIENLERILRRDKDRSYILSASTSAFADKIKIWEEAADNLMVTRMEEPMKLFFRIERMKETRFSSAEMNVPISKQMLLEIKGLAEATRNRMIPEIMKI
ncbi:MAG: ATPase domain-containing protein [Acidobacteriota bacterium]|jgi:KaiC/GvpD/RAD55 family RecA-like ATPase|nr:ATPase domain-containing protein [Acidobacteriota bacterium]